MTNDLLQVGVIAKAHGLKGEVLVTLTTDRTERLDAGNQLETDDGPLVVEQAVAHQHRWRVRFAGVFTREAAEELRGTALYAAPIDDPDTWFVHELIGAHVHTVGGAAVGTCVAVIDNPAHHLLELDDATLVPMPFVVDVDRDASPTLVVIDPPEGLLPDADGDA